MEFKSRTAIVDCAGWGLLILGIAVIVFRLNGTLTTSPIEADAFQNAALAVALARTGTFSQEITDPSPTMYREPLPPAALALQMAIDPRFSNVATTDELNREPAIVALKQHNLAWAILVLCGIPLLIRAFIKPRLVWFICSAAAIVLTSIFYLRRPEILDTFYTEIQASALLVWSAVAACAAVRTQKILYFLVLGALLGALVLTKAVFFYVMWPYLALLLVLLLTGRPQYTLRHGIVCITAALIGATVIAGPWLVRNQINFSTLKVASRGGVVLWIRALSNQMNDEEWRGAFYVYGPPEYATRLGMLAIWTLTLVSLIKRWPAMFGAFGLAVGMIAFYVAVSHAIPRYSAPAVPLMIVAIVLVAGWSLIVAKSMVDARLLNRSIRSGDSKG